MRLGITAGFLGGNWRTSIEKVKIAEDLGFDAVFVPEAWGVSAIPFLTAIAMATSRITIGSSILNCFSRTPAAMAQDFAALEVMSDGRMVLGLGVSGEFVIEHFHGLPFQKPLRRLREYVEVFNTLMSGERLQYEGEIFQMSRGFRLDYERRRDRVPVYIAAITPLSIRQTGEVADGIIPIHWPKGLFGQLREDLLEGARAAGRSDPDITIAARRAWPFWTGKTTRSSGGPLANPSSTTSTGWGSSTGRCWSATASPRRSAPRRADCASAFRPARHPAIRWTQSAFAGSRRRHSSWRSSATRSRRRRRATMSSFWARFT